MIDLDTRFAIQASARGAGDALFRGLRSTETGLGPRFAAHESYGSIASGDAVRGLAYAQHLVYPHLLRGLSIDRPNQVYAMDITYIPMARGFVYLVADLDW